MKARIINFLQRRLVVLTVIIAVLSVAALLARWHWIADLTSHFLPHYAFIAGLSAFGLWICRRRRWAAFAAFLAAVQLVQIGPYLPPLETAQEQADGFKIFQFNVGDRDGTYSVLPHWLDERAEEFDVVVLFEVDESWEQPLQRLAERFEVSALDLRSDPFGLALFTRLPGAEARIDYLSSLRLPSGVISVARGGRRPPLKIIASHPPPPINGAVWRARNAQFSALAEMASESDGQVALVADLNSSVWSPFYEELARTAGLRDAHAGHLYRPTWAPYSVPLAFGIAIDHLMISDGLISLRREFPPRMHSDHRPVVTTLKLRPEGNWAIPRPSPREQQDVSMQDLTPFLLDDRFAPVA